MTEQQAISAFAAEHKADSGALRSLVGFLRANIERNPELRKILLSGNERAIDAAISQGVRAWRDHSTRILSEMAAGESDWAKEARAKIANDVWEAAQARKGVPA